MGEVEVSSYEEVSKVEDDKKRKEADAEIGEISTVKRSDCSRLIVRWEKLIPTVALRILLVEADDSTRQIIAALLRKCSYKVAAVSDGLKAWEILKGRPNTIDLILTEVDLPSISGYALLTLIMEHEICKRIPVIMMSSHDSISTVYKCMLRGAADYLVKPIRRNELRNLWQHVWRRQSALRGVNTLHDESVGQDKVEATSENDTASSRSSRDLALIQNNKECIEKGSDAQSSCTKPDAEGESSHLDNMLANIQPTSEKLPSNDTRKQNHVPVSYSTESAAVEPQRQTLDAHNNSHVPVSCSTEAIDFMGASSGHNVSVDTVKSKYEFSPLLDLCLTRCSPSGFETQRTEEKSTLRQSNASAFSRYTGRPLLPTTSDINQKELEANSVDKFSGTGECKATSLYPHQRATPMKSSSDGLSLNNLCASFGSIFSPLFGKQSPILSTSSGNQVGPNAEVDPFYRSTWKSNSENLYANESHPSLQKKDKRFESLEDRGHISPTTEQSTTSNLCNGGASQLNMAYRSMTGSNSNFDHVAIPLPAPETKEEDAILNRSIQREAALNKFRLKRKDRCYEKKVRYESRKKLAEQRPRVKGQFVRQLPAETEQH